MQKEESKVPDPTKASVDKQSNAPEDDNDARSIFIRNVHFAVTEEKMRKHFLEDSEKDEIKRLTCLKNRFTHQPLGHWYIEFNTVQAAQDALRFDGTYFEGRILTVAQKKKRIPGRGQSSNRGNPMMAMMQMMMGRGGRGMMRGMRGMGGPMRGRGDFRGGRGRGGRGRGQGGDETN